MQENSRFWGYFGIWPENPTRIDFFGGEGGAPPSFRQTPYKTLVYIYIALDLRYQAYESYEKRSKLHLDSRTKATKIDQNCTVACGGRVWFVGAELHIVCSASCIILGKIGTKENEWVTESQDTCEVVAQTGLFVACSNVSKSTRARAQVLWARK